MLYNTAEVDMLRSKISMRYEGSSLLAHGGIHDNIVEARDIIYTRLISNREYFSSRHAPLLSLPIAISDIIFMPHCPSAYGQLMPL